MVATTANGQPAFAAYERGRTAVYRAHGVQVLTLTAAGVARVVIFLDPLFGSFHLPDMFEPAPPNRRGSAILTRPAAPAMAPAAHRAGHRWLRSWAPLLDARGQLRAGQRRAGHPGNYLPLPTPCAGWDLRTLLHHLSDSLDVLSEAICTGFVRPAPHPRSAGRHGRRRAATRSAVPGRGLARRRNAPGRLCRRRAARAPRRHRRPRTDHEHDYDGRCHRDRCPRLGHLRRLRQPAAVPATAWPAACCRSPRC